MASIAPPPSAAQATIPTHPSSHEEAPAQHRAGGRPKDQERQGRCIDAATLVTGLEVTVRMYRKLVNLGVGTGVVEAEAGKIVWERLCGPTGHHLLMKDREQETQCRTEDELKIKEKEQERKCWRDENLVRKLLRIRLSGVRAEEKRAKKILEQEIKSLTSVTEPGKMMKIWNEIRSARRETWQEKHPASQKKIEHLSLKARCCNKHKRCRRLDDLRMERMKKWQEIVTSQGSDVDKVEKIQDRLKLFMGDNSSNNSLHEVLQDQRAGPGGRGQGGGAGRSNGPDVRQGLREGQGARPSQTPWGGSRKGAGGRTTTSPPLAGRWLLSPGGTSRARRWRRCSVTTRSWC